MTIRMKTHKALSPILFAAVVSAMLFSFHPEPAAAVSKKDIAVLDRSSKAFVSVVKEAKPAVVHIRVEQTAKASKNPQQQYSEEFFNHPFFEQFFGPEFKKQQRQPRQQRKQQGQGSGFIISDDGYILTNNHVVENADIITVRLSDDKEVTAELVGADPQSDVALIKIESNEKLPTLPLGDSDALEVAEWVIAIGNPFGLSQTVTVGVVSAKGRSRVGINDYENFIQTDAAINPGNSGGPLLNIHGEVVGINSALFSRTGGYMGIGFAIPINMVKAIEDQLHSFGTVTRGWLGVVIQDIDKNLAESFGLEDAKGILISDVQENSPADKAGLVQGDVIIKLQNSSLKDVSDLRNKVALIRPDTSAKLDIVRDGKPKQIWVTIGKQPGDFGSQKSGSNSKMFKKFGFSLQNLTPDLAEKLGFENNQGVVVSNVEPGSPADKAGLKPGHLIEEVNRQDVANVKQLKSALNASKNSKQTLLRVNTGNSRQYVVLITK